MIKVIAVRVLVLTLVVSVHTLLTYRHLTNPNKGISGYYELHLGLDRIYLDLNPDNTITFHKVGYSYSLDKDVEVALDTGRWEILSDPDCIEINFNQYNYSYILRANLKTQEASVQCWREGDLVYTHDCIQLKTRR